MIRIPQIGGIFCNHIQRHTIGLSALSAWRLPNGRQSGSGKGRSHPTNEVWRIHQRHFTMFLSRIITSRYIAVKWLRRVYWLTSHEHRRFFCLESTILLESTDDSFSSHRGCLEKSVNFLGGEVSVSLLLLSSSRLFPSYLQRIFLPFWIISCPGWGWVTGCP